MELLTRLVTGDLDKYCAQLGIIGSIILFIYLASNIGAVIYTATAVLTFAVCVLWLYIRKQDYDLSPSSVLNISGHSRSLRRVFPSIFFLLLVGSILSVYFRPDVYQRPLLYYVFIVLMVGIIACEILFAGNNRVFILGQIFLVGISLAWTQQLLFPTLVGNDPWYHWTLTSELLKSSFIPSNFAYSNLPLFHILIAITSLISDFTYKLSAMVSVSLAQVICNGLFVYLIGSMLFKNDRIGLLAALVVAIANQNISMLIHTIPNGFGVIFIPLLVLLFFKASSTESISPKYLYLTILVMSTIILTHTISAIGTAVVLFIIWAGQYLYLISPSTATKRIIRISIPIIFCASMIAWWIYSSRSIEFLGEFILSGYEIVSSSSAPSNIVLPPLDFPLTERFFNNMGVFLFFTLSFIGCFHMISKKGDQRTFTVACIGIAPLFIGFFTLITGHSVIEDRWWYLAQVFLSIPLATGLVLLGSLKNGKRVPLNGIVIIALIVVAFLSIMSPQANINNDIFSPHSTLVYAPLQSEMDVTSFLDRNDGRAYSDHYFADRILYPNGYDIYNFDRPIATQDFDDLRYALILVREAILVKPFTVYGQLYSMQYNLMAEMERVSANRVYDSGTLYGYIPIA